MRKILKKAIQIVFNDDGSVTLGWVWIVWTVMAVIDAIIKIILFIIT